MLTTSTNSYLITLTPEAIFLILLLFLIINHFDFFLWKYPKTCLFLVNLKTSWMFGLILHTQLFFLALEFGIQKFLFRTNIIPLNSEGAPKLIYFLVIFLCISILKKTGKKNFQFFLHSPIKSFFSRFWDRAEDLIRLANGCTQKRDRKPTPKLFSVKNFWDSYYAYQVLSSVKSFDFFKRRKESCDPPAQH